MSLTTKLAVILAGAMWLGICAGLGVVADATPPSCYDALPAGAPSGSSHSSPGICPDRYSPAIYMLAVPGVVTLLVGLALPVGPSRPLPIPYPS